MDVYRSIAPTLARNSGDRRNQPREELREQGETAKGGTAGTGVKVQVWNCGDRVKGQVWSSGDRGNRKY